MLNDLLKVNDPEKPKDSSYSQSRVYLMITFLAMIVVITISLSVNADTELVKIITNTLYMMLLLFSGYSLTGKGFKTFEKIRNNINQNNN